MRIALICMAFWPTVATAETTICKRLSDYAHDRAEVPFDLAGADCTSSLMLGGATSKDCAWGFEYRAEQATSFFQSIISDLASCAAETTLDDPDVSHPDSYDLRQFELNDAIFSVSLKDKGALSQTYVFFRAVKNDP